VRSIIAVRIIAERHLEVFVQHRKYLTSRAKCRLAHEATAGHAFEIEDKVKDEGVR
jgi:hypothetical protein